MKSQVLSTILRVVRILVSVLVLALIVIYVERHWNDFSILRKITWKHISLLLLLLFLNSVSDAARFARLYRALGAPIRIGESFLLGQLVTMVNQLLPARMGTIVRAIYMKKRYSMPYSQTPAILLGMLVFSVFMGGLVMIVANTAHVMRGYTVPSLLWFGGVGASLSVCLFWGTLPEYLTLRLGRIGAMLASFTAGWRRLRQDDRCLFEASVYQILSIACNGLTICIAYQSLGLPLSPLLAVSIAVFTAFSNMFTITPGNLGIQEAVLGLLSQLAGFTFLNGVVVSAIIRAGNIVLALGFTPAAWWFLVSRNNSECYTQKGSGEKKWLM